MRLPFLLGTLDAVPGIEEELHEVACLAYGALVLVVTLAIEEHQADVVAELIASLVPLK